MYILINLIERIFKIVIVKGIKMSSKRKTIDDFLNPETIMLEFPLTTNVFPVCGYFKFYVFV